MPFTLATLAALVVRGWRTDTITAAVPHHLVVRMGFAPEDLLDLGWRRIFSSATLTHGPLEFWAAVLMIVFAVGVCELIGGSIIAGVTFWGVHILTLLAESLLVLPLLFVGSHAGEQIARLRDVGPSAGYVGALGLVCALLPRRWRYPAAAAVLLTLAYATFAPGLDGLGMAARLSAGVAHFIAFPLGWWSLLLWRRLRGRRDAVAASTDIPPAAGAAAYAAPALAVLRRRFARPSS